MVQTAERCACGRRPIFRLDASCLCWWECLCGAATEHTEDLGQATAWWNEGQVVNRFDQLAG